MVETQGGSWTTPKYFLSDAQNPNDPKTVVAEAFLPPKPKNPFLWFFKRPEKTPLSANERVNRRLRLEALRKLIPVGILCLAVLCLIKFPVADTTRSILYDLGSSEKMTDQETGQMQALNLFTKWNRQLPNSTGITRMLFDLFKRDPNANESQKTKTILNAREKTIVALRDGHFEQITTKEYSDVLNEYKDFYNKNFHSFEQKYRDNSQTSVGAEIMIQYLKEHNEDRDMNKYVSENLLGEDNWEEGNNGWDVIKSYLILLGNQ